MPEGVAIDQEYRGSNTYAVDGKGRITLPYKGAETYLIVLWPWNKAGTCVRVFPPVEADKLNKQLDAIPNANKGKSSLKRYIGSNSVKVKVDGAGRIPIPADMVEKAGLSGEAVVAGMGEKFEIWNVTKYNDQENKDLAVVDEEKTVEFIES